MQVLNIIKNFIFGKTLKKVYGIPPWECSVSCKESKKIWFNADLYYSYWCTDKSMRHTKMSKKLDIPFKSDLHQCLLERFRAGWVPWKDSKWLYFRRKDVQRIPTFFTSDLHFGHANVLNFCNRPWNTIEAMDAGLIKNWNSVVPSYGIVYVLGDLGFNFKHLKPIIDQLHGTLIMIRGNHDPSVNALYNLGFTSVTYGATIYIANQQVELSHCPARGEYREDTTKMHGPNENWHGERRHQKFSKVIAQDTILLHGHIHSPNKGQSTKIEGRQYDVGVDANNYKPVSLGQIESWINKYKRDNDAAV